MIETVKKRRRWPWAILVVLLLLIGGPIAWRSRPLSLTETRLLGAWDVDGGVFPSKHYTLTADRLYSKHLASSSEEGNFGIWSATGNQLVVASQMNEHGQWLTFRNRLEQIVGVRGNYVSRSTIHFISNDEFVTREPSPVDEGQVWESHWRRIPPEAAR